MMSFGSSTAFSCATRANRSGCRATSRCIWSMLARYGGKPAAVMSFHSARSHCSARDTCAGSSERKWIVMSVRPSPNKDSFTFRSDFCGAEGALRLDEAVLVADVDAATVDDALATEVIERVDEPFKGVAPGGTPNEVAPLRPVDETERHLRYDPETRLREHPHKVRAGDVPRTMARMRTTE